MEIEKTINIGKTLATELIAVGINTDIELKKIGSINALLLVNGLTFHEGCLNKLFAFEGAIQGIRWHELAKQEREMLKKDYYLKINKL